MATTSPEGIISANDLDFIQCKVVCSPSRAIEFKPVIIETSIYQDIFGNVMSGSIIVSDSSNNQNLYTLCGDEFLIFSLQKPGSSDPPMNKIFRIYSMKERNLTKDLNEYYTLNFCSEELYLNEQYKVSKSYKNAKISDIVKDIAYNYLKIPKDEFPDSNIEETLGEYNLIVPNFKPLEAINWLCTMARSNHTEIIGASYIFFQDRDGWNFKSILAIYGQYTKYGYYYNKYAYSVKNEDAALIELYNVISYEIMNTYNSMEQVQNGEFCNRLIALDHISRTHRDILFDYDDYFTYLKNNIDLYKKYHPYPVMSNAVDRFFTPHNKTYDCVIKVAYDANYVDKTLPYRLAQLGLSSIHRLKLLIPGDPYIKPGYVIYFGLQSVAPEDVNGQKKFDEMYSGRFLVTSVRHKLDNENNFDTTIEICKDAFPADINNAHGIKDFDNNNPEWIKVRSHDIFSTPQSPYWKINT